MCGSSELCAIYCGVIFVPFYLYKTQTKFMFRSCWLVRCNIKYCEKENKNMKLNELNFKIIQHKLNGQ